MAAPDTQAATFADPSPLLAGRPTRRISRPPSLRNAARLLSRAAAGSSAARVRGRVLREPSVLVREAAAEQLEERQAGWAYSRPVVALDLVWNLSFVLVAASVLALSRTETPAMPLRLWIFGYALQCVLHMLCVCIEYRIRSRHPADSVNAVSSSSSSSSFDAEENALVHRSPGGGHADCVNISKHLESANTMFSFIWWIVGFYWVSAGGQMLTHNAPQLYWLCIVFLAFDVFFVILCIALAFIVGIAVCCCLPCIIAILYAVSDQEGASEDDIHQIPRFKFQSLDEREKPTYGTRASSGGIMTECGTDRPIEKFLSAEDSECCICLAVYDDGSELRELPCSHHFHCSCIDKWLHINAICPLCKRSIRKSSGGGNSSGEEEI